MDKILGLLLLAGYIVLIVGLAAGVTYAVIKIFPTERTPKKPHKPDEPDEPDKPASDGGAGGGTLFRKSKRAAT